MKRAILIVLAVVLALVLGVGGILLYRKHQSDSCFEKTGQDAIAACTRHFIENKKLLPSSLKGALARRAELYAMEGALDLALADNAASLAVKVEGREMSVRLAAREDERSLVRRVRLGWEAKKPDLALQACAALDQEKLASSAQLLQACSLVAVLAGRYDLSAKYAWLYLGEDKNEPDMLMIAAMSSLASGATAGVQKALKRMELAAIPSGLKVKLALTLANIHSYLGDNGAGIAELDKALAAGQSLGKADLSELLVRKYELLCRSGRSDQALAYLDRALLADPDPSSRLPLFILKGQALEDLGRYGEALTEFNRAASADPARISPRVGAGMALVRLKRCPDAEREFAAALAKAGQNPGALLGAGYCRLVLRKDRRSASGFLQEALKGDFRTLAHPRTFSFMLGAMLRDPGIKGAHARSGAKVPVIHSGPVPPVNFQDMMDAYRQVMQGVTPPAFAK